MYATLTAILSGFLFVYLDFFCVVCHLIYERWSLDTVYCPAEDAPGDADFHLCKICLCLAVGLLIALCITQREAQNCRVVQQSTLSNKGILIQCLMRIMAMTLCGLHVCVFMFYLSK